MIVHFQLEIYDKLTKHYVPCWIGKDIEQARKMAGKPYYKDRGPVRIVRITHETVFKSMKNDKPRTANSYQEVY